jgi:AraC family transcriptional regulator
MKDQDTIFRETMRGTGPCLLHAAATSSHDFSAVQTGLAAHELDRLDFEPSPTHSTLDQAALHVAQLIKAELAEPDSLTELYLDSLMTILGIQVLRNNSTVAKPSKAKGAGLSDQAAEKVKDYIQENLARKLTLAELAGLCGLSPGHFTRSFAGTFGITPHRYVLARRLEFAERLLQETDMPIKDVAYLSGFSSQSHLTYSLRMHRHTTPRQLR